MLSHHSDLTDRIIGAGIAVHRALGPGLLESAYAQCLILGLQALGLPTRNEVPIDLTFRGHAIPAAYRLDLVVAEQVIVEVKAIDRLLPIHEAQLLTYLRLTGLKVGLLMNFNVTRLAHGLKRMVNA
jgi:GxxExxY protein